eukprot:363738-Chlamydomonas_euryale.AAC.11
MGEMGSGFRRKRRAPPACQIGGSERCGDLADRPDGGGGVGRSTAPGSRLLPRTAVMPPGTTRGDARHARAATRPRKISRLDGERAGMWTRALGGAAGGGGGDGPAGLGSSGGADRPQSQQPRRQQHASANGLPDFDAGRASFELLEEDIESIRARIASQDAGLVGSRAAPLGAAARRVVPHDLDAFTAWRVSDRSERTEGRRQRGTNARRAASAVGWIADGCGARRRCGTRCAAYPRTAYGEAGWPRGQAPFPTMPGPSRLQRTRTYDDAKPLAPNQRRDTDVVSNNNLRLCPGWGASVRRAAATLGA